MSSPLDQDKWLSRGRGLVLMQEGRQLLSREHWLLCHWAQAAFSLHARSHLAFYCSLAERLDYKTIAKNLMTIQQTLHQKCRVQDRPALYCTLFWKNCLQLYICSYHIESNTKQYNCIWCIIETTKLINLRKEEVKLSSLDSLVGIWQVKELQQIANMVQIWSAQELSML